MKKILICLPVLFLLLSCENSETNFPDFTFQTIYFPIQRPVRTVVLGDEIRSDNTIDRERAFTIAANIGGLYENKENRTLAIRLAPELVPSTTSQLLITNTIPADTLVLLPANYYTASSLSEIIIPAGKFDGRIRINLTDAFFNDPRSVNLKFVLPVVITEAKNSKGIKDSVLTGAPAVSNPLLRLRTRPSDWLTGREPKDYTLFAVNYTNRFHGAFFLFGQDSIFTGTTFSNRRVYSTKPDIERNIIANVRTVSLRESTVDRLGGTNTGPTFRMRLRFDETQKTIAISSERGGVPVTGTGKLLEIKDGISWGGQSRKTYILNYRFTDATGNHRCKDTLVYRTSGVVYREFVLR